MTITAKIHKVFDSRQRAESGSCVKAIASINIDDAFAIHGVKVLEGKNGDSVVMPSTKYKDKYQDIAHPISVTARSQLNEAVLTVYENYISQENPKSISQAM
jgi:stage V sporulation protein G